MAISSSTRENLSFRSMINDFTRSDPDRNFMTKGKRLADFTANFNKSCAWCGKQISNRPHFDNLIVPGQGGTFEVNNCVLACGSCNDTRRNIPWRLFAMQQPPVFGNIMLTRSQKYVPLNLTLLGQSNNSAVKSIIRKYKFKIDALNLSFGHPKPYRI